MRQQSFTARFTDLIPSDLERGVLYVSGEYSTASHLCACGCGNRVATPLSPVDWTLTFDGAATLHPSIGNGQFPCRSHYLIQNGDVVWLRQMREAETNSQLAQDIELRSKSVESQRSLISRFWHWLTSR